MKINGVSNIQKIMNAYKTNKTQNVNKVSLKEDKIEISQQGKDYQFAIDALKDVEDIREDKVNDIKIRIENGTYTVDKHKLAKSMIKEDLNWRG
ncbi:flagellar biosynthesis anti-sigma factor FlgM [Tepidibacter aestuarii]|uniref:flagellar biosynthesis anti-sigma factor FlgM n=1 Tax=Tepidibacter aestuarii TaxID=2925782 RepID=UPI0020BFD326|nr:flagellar biosynthesis anti-sigma factor FlgM [Tepidibacter aestuarii]CAH2211877.1 anti-sigma factor repressor of sigma(D)-dependent transcription [Tepidibacter aestuarii]